MEKSTRAELIAALVTDKFSGFKEGDESLLEAASDARLEEFRGAADGARASVGQHTRLETDHRNTSARLKVAEDRLKATEQNLTEEEFLAKAPESIKTLIEEHRAAEAAEKASIVSQLKDLGRHTEDELKKKPMEDLRTLAAYARVEVPDFSGRAVPKEKSDATSSYMAPNPYEAGLKALRSKAN